MQISFFQTSIDSDSRRRMDALRAYIKNLPLTAFDGIDKDVFSKQVAERYQYPELPTFSAEGVERDDAMFISDSEYANVTVYFPFSGDAKLFGLYGSTRPMIPPPPVFSEAGGYLSKTYRLRKSDLAKIDQLVQSEHLSAEQYYVEVRRMAPLLNNEMLSTSRSAVDQRLKELSENQAAQAKLNESKIVVRKRADQSIQVILPPKPTQIAIAERKTVSSPVREYVLEISEYNDILKTVSSMVKVMERSPSVFASMGEESLRTILLVALNGVYEGQATGETFNGHGKTDILIRREDRNVFIAECLMWHGPAHIKSKMDEQLFRYAMWRDSKLALIVFNRGANFSHVLDAMQNSIESHPQRLRRLDWTHETGCRYEFCRHDDKARRFILTALAFDIPIGS